MQMTDAEILQSYRGAKDPVKQIGVLADLNCVKEAEMARKLQALGVSVEIPPEKPRPVRKPPIPTFDVARALELHAEGLCDLDIAERLGVKQSNFAAWRRGQGLKANAKRAEKPKKQTVQTDQTVQETAGAMSVGRMAEIFARIAKWHPDAQVTMDGKPIAAVMLSSLFDSTADAEVQVFLMEG